MYSRILVAIAPDHGADIDGALKIAETLRATDGEITLVTVVEPLAGYITQYLPDGQMEKNQKEVEERLAADAAGLTNARAVVLQGAAGPSLTDYAQEYGIDLIVVASHRPGLQDYFLGSTAGRVVRHAHCAVHVIR